MQILRQSTCLSCMADCGEKYVVLNVFRIAVAIICLELLSITVSPNSPYLIFKDPPITLMLKCCWGSDGRMEGQTLVYRQSGSDNVLLIVGCKASSNNVPTAPVANIQPLQYCHRWSNLAIEYISATPIKVHEVSSICSIGDCLLTSANARAVVDCSRLRTPQLAADASRRLQYYTVYMLFTRPHPKTEKGEEVSHVGLQT